MVEIGGLIGSVAGVLRDLSVDEDAIATVVAKLQAVADDVEGSGFRDLDLPGAAFGGSSRGQALSLHHAAAYNVVVKTLEGLVRDLQDFGTGVTRAVELVKDADTMTATDLKRQADAVAVLTYEAEHSDADRLRDQARDAQPVIPDVVEPPAVDPMDPTAQSGGAG
ncbi:MAG: hypothetical protein R2731_09700 [Nocardioides sp.]